MTREAAIAFIRRETTIISPPLTPGIRLYQATEITPIWRATEAKLANAEVPPPFWAFAWAGGQALARYILDNPETVADKRVLDFGSGSGLVAIAAAKAGAASVRASEIDPIATAAIALNAGVNGVEIEIVLEDVIGQPSGAEIILIGDLCYEKPLTDRLVAWLRLEAAAGTLVLMGDPGRSYLPVIGMERLAAYEVATSLELEDRISRDALVWRILPV